MRRRSRQLSMEERFLDREPVHPERQRRQVPPFLAMVGRGIVRFLVFVAVAAGIVVGIGAGAGAMRGGDIMRSIVLALYIGGAGLAAFAVFTFTNQPRHWVGEYGEDLGTSGGGDLPAFIAVGVTLVGLGVLLDSLG
jgi:hypothetical protein